MKKITTSTFLLLLTIFSFSSFAQDNITPPMEIGGEYIIGQNDAGNPCITDKEYEAIDLRCAENRQLLGLESQAQKSGLTTLLNWPLRAAEGFTDCSYYAISAYIDQNTATGVIQDYNCGTNTYDGHHGTDIATFPFHFYKMDHDQVEVVAAADGVIIDKGDGNFDKNCASNSLPANFIIIQHSDGSTALYWHMKKNSVTPKSIGQTVVKGEYLGIVGSSGSSSGPHLHFEIWAGSTSSTYIDPYSGTCNILNANSWWATQKDYREPSILKASVHITDVVLPPCPQTETLNESTSFPIPFQGPGLPAGAAKFYIFMRNETSGMTGSLSILNPDGTTFNSWSYTSSNNYNGSYWGWTKYLPANPGTYTFQAIYNGITCAQSFDVGLNTGLPMATKIEHLNIYPNPTCGTITISGEDIDNGNYTIAIKNVFGQEVFVVKNKVENNSVHRSFTISELPDGIYFLVIETGKTRTVKKISKQNK